MRPKMKIIKTCGEKIKLIPTILSFSRTNSSARFITELEILKMRIRNPPRKFRKPNT